MDVLLIQPNYHHARASEGARWGTVPPLGLAYIAAVLEQHGIHVRILDANALHYSAEQVMEHVRNVKPDMIGISIMTPAHGFSAEIARGVSGECLTVAGGPHASGAAEALLNEGFDIAVRGEGEYSFLEIAQEKPHKDILGISYKHAGRVHHNPDRPVIKDVDSIPFPARHLLLRNGVDFPYWSTAVMYRPWSPILSSRGCPYSCYYCNKTIFGQGFRPRSAKNVVDEMGVLHDNYGVKEIDFFDDCFNFDLKRAEEILDAMIAKKFGFCLRFSNGIRVDKINERILDKMKRAGCDYVAFGIESGDQGVLNRIPKGITLDMVRNAVKLTKKSGITVTGFFMLGLIGDTKETMQKTVEFAKELDVDIAQFSIATPYPGTRMWDMVHSDGRMLVNNLDELFHTSGKLAYSYPGTATPEEVAEAYRSAHKQYYMRPRYMLEQLARIRSFRQVEIMLQGVKSLLDIQKKKAH